MTSYESEADYIKDQLSSYRKGKKILKDYKLKICNELGIDHRGDLEKALEGMDEGIKYIERQKKNLNQLLKQKTAIFNCWYKRGKEPYL